jgi:hypothetical protein
MMVVTAPKIKGKSNEQARVSKGREPKLFGTRQFPSALDDPPRP